jgi:PAS domain S-box-containing protein
MDNRAVRGRLQFLIAVVTLPMLALAALMAWLYWDHTRTSPDAASALRWIIASAALTLALTAIAARYAAIRIFRRVHRTSALFEAVINMTPDLVFVKDLQSRALLRNPAALFGKSWDDIAGRKEAEWHRDPREAEQVVENDRKVIASGVSMQFEEMFTTPKGVRMLLSTKSPLLDEQGKIVGTIGVSTDITERENRARHVEFIMRELSHRSKNLLAIIQSIARQSIKQSADLEDFESRFIARLAALARLHDLLVQENWHGASMQAIVETQVGPFASGRLTASGPDVLLRPAIAQLMSMVFHELATNASKYGALSSDAGTVFVKWGYAGANDERLFVRWKETGGPPVVPPSRKGFGTVVLERTVLQVPDAKVVLEFADDGVAWSLDAPAAPLKEDPASAETVATA